MGFSSLFQKFLWDKKSLKIKRYLCPVDKSRINEFGFAVEDEDKPLVEGDSSSEEEEVDQEVEKTQ